MKVLTHNRINANLCGKPIFTENGASRVELQTNDAMAVDDYGLVHGGFIFGLADYAAMIAVNDPNVVLGSAEVKFLKPVRVGQELVAEAKTEIIDRKKHTVAVIVSNKEIKVFEGQFKCIVLEKHVLS